MFGMGGTEILVILIVALLFLGPDKLPEAAKKISKGIRDIKKQSRALQQTIEDDENIGGALRDLRSALRGEDALPAPKPKVPKQIEAATPDPVAPAVALTAAELPAGAATATAATGELAPAPAKDPGDADAEVAANAFADAFEGGHMSTHAEVAAPVANGENVVAAPPKITLPSTAGEPGDATRDKAAAASAAADAGLAALVKPAPNTIARGAAPSEPTAPSEPSEPESKHG